MRKIQISLFLLPIIIVLAACSGGTGGGYNTHRWQPKSQTTQPAAQQPSALSSAATEPATQSPEEMPKISEDLPPVKVAILLPLSGQHAQLGQAMLQAAQLALFDVGFDNFELAPKDTNGTQAGAAAAARAALQEGAGLVLGPIFADEVRAAQNVTQPAGVNLIAFSTDWTLANSQTYLIGFLPFDQVERVVGYAKYSGVRNIGVLSPADNYGNGVVSAYRAIAGNLGIAGSKIARFSPTGEDLHTVTQQFAASGTYDAVLMPVGGAMARQVGAQLTAANLPAHQVRRLGTGLVDDAVLATDRTLNGLWFAAPDPNARRRFERRYAETYKAQPPRIASLAYDATALAAVLARSGLKSERNRPAFYADAITNPNGFSGVDGIFRFRRDGIVERGLAVLEYRNGQIVVIDRAPATFQRSTQ